MTDSTNIPKPTSPKRRHQLFQVAMGIAAGKSNKEAMIEAGWSETTADRERVKWTDLAGEMHECQVHEHPVVAEFLEDMHTETRRRSRITLDTIVERLDLVYKQAMHVEDLKTARGATVDLAKVLGLVVERRHLTVKPISQMSESELIQLIDDDEEARP